MQQLCTLVVRNDAQDRAHLLGSTQMITGLQVLVELATCMWPPTIIHFILTSKSTYP